MDPKSALEGPKPISRTWLSATLLLRSGWSFFKLTTQSRSWKNPLKMETSLPKTQPVIYSIQICCPLQLPPPPHQISFLPCTFSKVEHSQQSCSWGHLCHSSSSIISRFQNRTTLIPWLLSLIPSFTLSLLCHLLLCLTASLMPSSDNFPSVLRLLILEKTPICFSPPLPPHPRNWSLPTLLTASTFPYFWFAV